MKEKEEERLKLLKEEENKLYESKKIQYICGIDEAGRGPLAGPVVVGAVILPKDSMIEGVNDSKKISEKKREKLYDLITNEAISYAVGVVDQNQIDNSLKELTVKPDVIMVDALNKIDTLGIPYISVVKGDSKIYSIAAASIVAKVTRDKMMYEWDKVYPAYGFAKHKGYGTAFHIQAIRENGICQIHRKTFINDDWIK